MTTVYEFDGAVAAVLAERLAMRGRSAATLAMAIGVPTTTVENWLAVREPMTVSELASVSVELAVTPSVFVAEAEAHRIVTGEGS